MSKTKSGSSRFPIATIGSQEPCAHSKASRSGSVDSSLFYVSSNRLRRRMVYFVLCNACELQTHCVEQSSASDSTTVGGIAMDLKQLLL